MVKSINMLRPKFTTHADGSDAVLFMHELVGEEDGPTIGISASIHGNENTGSQVILDLYRALKDMPLKGRHPAPAGRQSAGLRRQSPALHADRRAQSQPRIPGRSAGNYTPAARRGASRASSSTRSTCISTCIPAPIARPSTTSTSGTTKRCRAPSARRSSIARAGKAGHGLRRHHQVGHPRPAQHPGRGRSNSAAASSTRRPMSSAPSTAS